MKKIIATVILSFIGITSISQLNPAKQATANATELESGKTYMDEDFREMIGTANLEAYIPGDDHEGYHCFAKITGKKSVVLFAYEFDNNKEVLYLHAFPFNSETWEALPTLHYIFSHGQATPMSTYHSVFLIKKDLTFTIIEQSNQGESETTYQLTKTGLSVISA